MTPPARPIDKVLIYATLRERLLVFAEPDSPQMPLQVPGGTVDPGEDVHLAAYREFEEETGIKCATAWLISKPSIMLFPMNKARSFTGVIVFICGYGTNSQKRGIIMKCRPVMAARQSFSPLLARPAGGTGAAGF